MTRDVREIFSRHSGFTLIELMIAMVLGLLIMTGVVTLFSGSRQSFDLDQQISLMQDEARFALDEIARDVRMAGYYAEALVPGAITPMAGLTVGTDCGPAAQSDWILKFTDETTGELNSLTSVDNATAAAAAASYSCIGSAELKPDTDLVGVKRVVGSTVDVADLQAGMTYLRSNSTLSVMYTHPTPGIAVPVPFGNWQYRPRIYFVRPNTEPGDGVPSLCRKVLTAGGPPSMETECIARGIEDLQIDYGLDLNGDGAANRYVPNPTLTQLQQVVSARIFLLARTSRPDVGYTDDRTYVISNAPNYTPNDNFHRRVYSMTVAIHNLRNIRSLGI